MAGQIVSRASDLEIAVHKEYLSTGATTSAEVWAPATGKRIVLTDYDIQDGGGGVTSLFFTSDAAPAAETINDSDKRGTTGRVFKGNFAANGGIAVHRHLERRGPLNGALRVSMPATGAYLYVSGYEEPAVLSGAP